MNRASIVSRFRAQALDPAGAGQWALREDLWIAVDASGRVAAVEDWRDQGCDLDLREMGVLMPGFVDAHLHFPQTRVMGQASGPLLPWLADSVFPEETRFADADYAAEVAEEFCMALLEVGTTAAFVYGSAHASASERLFARLESLGLQAIAGPVLMDGDAPPELTIGVEAAESGLEALRTRWHGAAEGRLRLGVIPRFALSCSPALMQMAGRYAQTHELWISTHIAETVDEYAAACERFGASDYLEVYERFGLVGARTVLAHCIHLDEGEWTRLRTAEAIVAHCPDSNDFLGSGSMPTAALIDPPVAITVGSDVAAGRGFCMRAHLRAAYDCALRGGLRLRPETLLDWGTAGAAARLGFESRGSPFRVGAWADWICVGVPRWAKSVEAMSSAIVFDPSFTRVEGVWLLGQRRW